MENVKSGQTLKTVVPSVARDDRLSSHQCIKSSTSEIPSGLFGSPPWVLSQRWESKWSHP